MFVFDERCVWLNELPFILFYPVQDSSRTLPNGEDYKAAVSILDEIVGRGKCLKVMKRRVYRTFVVLSDDVVVVLSTDVASDVSSYVVE